MSEVDRLRAQVKAAQQELNQAEDAEFCKPENIRNILNLIAKASGGIVGADKMTLSELSAKIISDVKRGHTAYMDQLYSNRNGRRGC